MEITLVPGHEHTAGLTTGQRQQDIIRERLRHAADLESLLSGHVRQEITRTVSGARRGRKRPSGSLDDARPLRVRVLGADLGPSILVTSVLFALGHLATELDANRLGVFFPALLFGWLRARTGGIGAGVAFHALANLFTAFLARSYGFSG